MQVSKKGVKAQRKQTLPPSVRLPYLRHKVLLAPDGVLEPLHQQRVELLQDQSGALHLAGAPSCAAVRCVVGTAVGLRHAVLFCSQTGNNQ